MKSSKKKTILSQTKIDPLSLDDVPGIGPVAVKLLKDEGIETTLALHCETPTRLKDITGMDGEKAGEAFAHMRKGLEEAGFLSNQIMTGAELLKIRLKIGRLRIGCNALDMLLNGGIECRSITEFFGVFASGKTQISHQLAIQALRPIEDGGLMEDPKKPSFVLYIDTEKTCRPERMKQMMAGKGMIPDFPSVLKQKILDKKDLTEDEQKIYDDIKKSHDEKGDEYLSRVLIQKAGNSYALLSLVKNAIGLCQGLNIRLIIVDSGTSLPRAEFLGRGNTKARSDLLSEILHTLGRIAETFNLPVVFVNQIYNKPDQEYGQDPDHHFGGNILAHTIPYRIKLEKFTKSHKATIVKSPYQANDEVKFDVTEEGVVDLK